MSNYKFVGQKLKGNDVTIEKTNAKVRKRKLLGGRKSDEHAPPPLAENSFTLTMQLPATPIARNTT